MVVLAGARFAGQVWAPTAYTKPLSDRPVSDGPRLIALIERHWRLPGGARLQLDDWQKAGLCHILERYPADWPVARLRGRLRYRQVVWSMGRQNGKSIIGAVLSLYGLLQHVQGPSVVGVATSVEQANVVYDRAKYAVRNDPHLNRVLKATGTRGIVRRDGAGQYAVKPALEEGLQSVPITLCIADELHLSKVSMWDSIVNGQRAQPDGLLVGITTAGDESSLLLKRLYKQGYAAIDAGQDDLERQRFGFFLWEAPEGCSIDNDADIAAANPAIACGRIEVATVRSDIRDLPEVDQLRYTFNRFVAAINSWLPMQKWRDSGTGGIPAGAGTVFSIARTQNWEYASITGTAKVDGKLHTELVASIVRPSGDKLARLCEHLADTSGVFAMEGSQLGALGKHLKARGCEVWALSETEIKAASAAAYASIVTGRVTHAADPLLTRQMPIAQRKNVGEGWRLSPADSADHVDAVMATIIGLHVADTRPETTLQLF